MKLKKLGIIILSIIMMSTICSCGDNSSDNNAVKETERIYENYFYTGLYKVGDEGDIVEGAYNLISLDDDSKIVIYSSQEAYENDEDSEYEQYDYMGLNEEKSYKFQDGMFIVIDGKFGIEKLSDNCLYTGKYVVGESGGIAAGTYRLNATSDDCRIIIYKSEKDYVDEEDYINYDSFDMNEEKSYKFDNGMYLDIEGRFGLKEEK